MSCGLRLPERRGPARRVVDRWSRRGTQREDWVWPALALSIVGAVGAFAAIAVTRESGTPTLVATRVRLVAAPTPTATTATTAAPIVTASVPTPTVPPATTAARGSSALTSWTVADGYTVVLISIARANGRAAAEHEAKLAAAGGLTQVGILVSDDFAGLAPGYFVVFSGVFDTSGPAIAHLADVHAAGFPAAYERHITR